MNPQDKMLQIYIQNMQKTIESLCKLVNTLVSDDQIVYDAYQNIKQILGEIKYFQKFNNKNPLVSKCLSQTINIINSHSQHHPISTIKQDYLPQIKNNQSINLKGLATIAQKQSQQNLLHNYIRKQSKRKMQSKNNKTHINNYSKTINQPVGYLNTSRQFEIIREQTRRSLDNPGISSSDKKPLYKQLQKFKGNQQILPAVRDYLDKHNHKKYVTSKNPNYTITKFL